MGTHIKSLNLTANSSAFSVMLFIAWHQVALKSLLPLIVGDRLARPLCT